jgi:hypothetical protein
MGWALLHLTFEAAQASQEARSFGLRSLSDLDLGAEVGTEAGPEVGPEVGPDVVAEAGAEVGAEVGTESGADVGALNDARSIGGLKSGCSSCIDGCHGICGAVKDMIVIRWYNDGKSSSKTGYDCSAMIVGSCTRSRISSKGCNSASRGSDGCYISTASPTHHR